MNNQISWLKPRLSGEMLTICRGIKFHTSRKSNKTRKLPKPVHRSAVTNMQKRDFGAAAAWMKETLRLVVSWFDALHRRNFLNLPSEHSKIHHKFTPWHQKWDIQTNRVEIKASKMLKVSIYFDEFSLKNSVGRRFGRVDPKNWTARFPIHHSSQTRYVCNGGVQICEVQWHG